MKSGRVSKAACEAWPSHGDSVNLGDQLSEQHVSASWSQASPKYGKSRNKQCTCNSLTFLAFFHENENITRADIELVLDKGNMMYNEVRKTVNHIHLTTDELPHEVTARRFTHYVDMTQLSRYGTLGEPLHPTVDSFLDLESGLSCLLTEVQFALLLMTQLCIAVFRTRTGRYGFFDPHSRTSKGLPLSPDSLTPGTAVMLTFTRLSDMIDRLMKFHRMVGTQLNCTYELKPVEFYDRNPVSLNDAVLNTDCRPTAVTVDAPALLDEAADESSSPTLRRNTPTDSSEHILPDKSTQTPAVKQQEVHITSPSHDAPRVESKLTDQVKNHGLSDPSDNIFKGVSTVITFTSSVRQQELLPNLIPNAQTEPEPLSEFSFLPSHDASHSVSYISSPFNSAASNLSDTVLQNISCKLSKLSKQQRKKINRRLMVSEKPNNNNIESNAKKKLKQCQAVQR